MLSPKNKNYVIVEGFFFCFLTPFPISKGSMNVHTYIYIHQKNQVLLTLSMDLMFAGSFFSSSEVMFKVTHVS